MSKYSILFLGLLLSLLTACIGDDIIADEVPERLRINNRIDSLKLGDSFQFEVMFFNNIGQAEDRQVDWNTSDANIISVSPSGLATAHEKGVATITATVNIPDRAPVEEAFEVIVSDVTTEIEETMNRSGSIKTTSSYVLTGDFEFFQAGNSLILSFDESYRASSALPGLYVYLTNNPNTTTNAYEIGKVTQFSGTHTYEIPADIGLDTYNYLLFFCKPFRVKVGDGEIN
ncbi:MAG: DM13 domain-containing protein [Saprospiraceae bacterium]|nr:DM13 domain-containing protein [Saprospiraceae bacterium]